MNAPARLASLAVLIALAACGAEPGQGIAPATAPDTALQRQAGSWVMQRQVIAYDATGKPADTAQAGKAAVGTREVSGPLCLSAGTVAHDDLGVRLREAVQFGQEWKVERSDFRGGGVDFAASLQSKGQGNRRITITGTLDASQTNLILITTERQSDDGAGEATTTLHIRNKRVGDCVPVRDMPG